MFSLPSSLTFLRHALMMLQWTPVSSSYFYAYSKTHYSTWDSTGNGLHYSRVSWNQLWESLQRWWLYMPGDTVQVHRWNAAMNKAKFNCLIYGANGAWLIAIRTKNYKILVHRRFVGNKENWVVSKLNWLKKLNKIP